MLKKTLSAAIISSLFFVSHPTMAEQSGDIKTQTPEKENFDVLKNDLQGSSFEKNLEKIQKDNPDIFKNQSMSEDDKKIEQLMIERIDTLYFEKSSLTTDEKNQLFSHYISFIMQGFNNAADAIWEYSKSNDEFNINLDYYNESGFSPLLAAAISDKEGGNVEYAIKLLKKGANPNQITPKKDMNALSLAATVDNYKVVIALLMAGADPLYETEVGFNALEYAKKHESYRSFLILLNYHAMLSGVSDLKEIVNSSENANK